MPREVAFAGFAGGEPEDLAAPRVARGQDAAVARDVAQQRRAGQGEHRSGFPGRPHGHQALSGVPDLVPLRRPGQALERRRDVALEETAAVHVDDDDAAEPVAILRVVGESETSAIRRDSRKVHPSRRPREDFSDRVLEPPLPSLGPCHRELLPVRRPVRVRDVVGELPGSAAVQRDAGERSDRLEAHEEAPPEQDGDIARGGDAGERRRRQAERPRLGGVGLRGEDFRRLPVPGRRVDDRLSVRSEAGALDGAPAKRQLAEGRLARRRGATRLAHSESAQKSPEHERRGCGREPASPRARRRGRVNRARMSRRDDRARFSGRVPGLSSRRNARRAPSPGTARSSSATGRGPRDSAPRWPSAPRAGWPPASRRRSCAGRRARPWPSRTGSSRRRTGRSGSPPAGRPPARGTCIRPCPSRCRAPWPARRRTSSGLRAPRRRARRAWRGRSPGSSRTRPSTGSGFRASDPGARSPPRAPPRGPRRPECRSRARAEPAEARRRGGPAPSGLRSAPSRSRRSRRTRRRRRSPRCSGARAPKPPAPPARTATAGPRPPPRRSAGPSERRRARAACPSPGRPRPSRRRRAARGPRRTPDAIPRRPASPDDKAYRHGPKDDKRRLEASVTTRVG